VELFGGAGEVTVPGDRLDVSELAQLHVAINRRSRLIA
jgi:hypothetical protein